MRPAFPARGKWNANKTRKQNQNSGPSYSQSFLSYREKSERWETDRETDRQADRQTELKTDLYSLYGFSQTYRCLLWEGRTSSSRKSVAGRSATTLESLRSFLELSSCQKAPVAAMLRGWPLSQTWSGPVLGKGVSHEVSGLDKPTR